ncbi:hypothetical protein ACIPIN_08750 [Pseudomonas sp. NPDC087697]|uniref:hypothetical protein n=1 Tax=Pseudomonas sp. NPDC087697 TaxID=3364447 RepID=UPI0037F23681
MLARDGARLAIGGTTLSEDHVVEAQVCGTPGNRVQHMRGGIRLKAGLHCIATVFNQGADAEMWRCTEYVFAS